MSSTVTVTGDAGPGIAVAAEVITGVASFTIKTGGILEVTLDSGIVKTFDIVTEATLTLTKSGNDYSLTVAT